MQHNQQPEDKTLIRYYKKLHEDSIASKEEKKEPIVAPVEKKTVVKNKKKPVAKTQEFRPWGKLHVRLQNLTKEYFNAEDWIALSQTSKAYRQSSKAIILKRLFPVDFARVERIESSPNYARAFKSAYRRDIVHTQAWIEDKWIPCKSSPRHAKLLIFCKEGRLAELKNEKLTAHDFYNIADGQKYTLCFWAARCGQHFLNYIYGEILKYFPEKENIHHRLDEFNNKPTLLHSAAELNQLSVVKTLLLLDTIHVDTRNAWDQTPLHVTAYWGHQEMTQLLLDHKAEPNACTAANRTAIHNAAEYGHLQVVELLLKHKAYIDQTCNTEKSALTLAAANSHYGIVTLLLQHNAHITLRDHGKTAFEWATDPTIKIVLLIAEIDLFIQENPPAKLGLFADSIKQLQQLKIALEKKNFVQIENLKIPNQGTPGQIYQKALQIVELMKPKPEPEHQSRCAVM